LNLTEVKGSEWKDNRDESNEWKLTEKKGNEWKVTEM